MHRDTIWMLGGALAIVGLLYVGARKPKAVDDSGEAREETYRERAYRRVRGWRQ